MDNLKIGDKNCRKRCFLFCNEICFGVIIQRFKILKKIYGKCLDCLNLFYVPKTKLGGVVEISATRILQKIYGKCFYCSNTF